MCVYGQGTQTLSPPALSHTTPQAVCIWSKGSYTHTNEPVHSLFFAPFSRKGVRVYNFGSQKRECMDSLFSVLTPHKLCVYSLRDRMEFHGKESVCIVCDTPPKDGEIAL